MCMAEVGLQQQRKHERAHWNPTFGLTTCLIFFTWSKTSSYGSASFHMQYAIAIVALRETP